MQRMLKLLSSQLMEGPKGNHPKLIHEVVGLDFIILQHFMKSIFSSDNSLAQLKWNSEENSSNYEHDLAT